MLYLLPESRLRETLARKIANPSAVDVAPLSWQSFFPFPSGVFAKIGQEARPWLRGRDDSLRFSWVRSFEFIGGG